MLYLNTLKEKHKLTRIIKSRWPLYNTLSITRNTRGKHFEVSIFRKYSVSRMGL